MRPNIWGIEHPAAVDVHFDRALTTSCMVGHGLASGWLVDLYMMGAGARGLIMAECRVTGLSPVAIAALIAEIGPL